MSAWLTLAGSMGAAAAAIFAALAKRMWHRADERERRTQRLEQALWIAAKHLPEDVQKRVERAMFPWGGDDQ